MNPLPPVTHTCAGPDVFMARILRGLRPEDRVLPHSGRGTSSIFE
jgi:hypothetical protein